MSTPQFVPSPGALRQLRRLLGLKPRWDSRPNLEPTCNDRPIEAQQRLRHLSRTNRPRRYHVSRHEGVKSHDDHSTSETSLRYKARYSENTSAIRPGIGDAQSDLHDDTHSLSSAQSAYFAPLVVEMLPPKQRTPSRKGRRKQRYTSPDPSTESMQHVTHQLSGSETTEPSHVESLCPLPDLQDKHHHNARYLDWVNSLHKKFHTCQQMAQMLRGIELARDTYGHLAAISESMALVRTICSSIEPDRWDRANYLLVHVQSRLSKRMSRGVALYVVRKQSDRLNHHPEPLYHLIDWTKKNFRSAHVPIYDYLLKFAEHDPGLAAQRAELDKVIQALTNLQLHPTNGLILPLLRSLDEQNKLAEAYSQLYSFEQQYPDLLFSLNPYLALVFASIRLQQWSDIEALFRHLHAQRVPRKFPSTFSHLFIVALTGFAQHNPPSAVYDFLMSHIATGGLVPTRKLYAHVAAYFVRCNQIQLLSRWAIERHRHFPNLLVPLHAPWTGYEIVKAWEQSSTGPTCVYMVKTLKAILHGITRVEISPQFRTLILEAVKVDVARRALSLHQIMAHEISGLAIHSIEKQPWTFWHSLRDHNGALKYAGWVLGLRCQIQDHAEFAPRTNIAIQDLQRAMLAAEELVMMIDDYQGFVATHGFPAAPIRIVQPQSSHESSFSAQTSPHLHWKLQHNAMSQKHLALERLILDNAPVLELCGAVQDYFSSLASLGITDLTTSFNGMVRALATFGRWRHAIDLLNLLRETKWFPGLLKLELLDAWVEGASALKNREIFADALWALIDNASSLHITPRFLTLVELVQSRLHWAVARNKTRIIDMAQIRQTGYLLNRVYRIYWHQTGRPHSRDMSLGLVKNWRENVERARCTVPDQDQSSYKPRASDKGSLAIPHGTDPTLKSLVYWPGIEFEQ